MQEIFSMRAGSLVLKANRAEIVFFFLRICLFIIYFSEPGTCAGGFPAVFTINISYKQTNKLFHHHNALAKVARPFGRLFHHRFDYSRR